MVINAMTRKAGVWLAIVLALAFLAATLWAAAGSARASRVGQATIDDPPRREREGDAAAPLISFIDSPTAQCIRPEQHTDVCYIQWYYLYVTASSPEYIISMTVSIDDRLQAYYGGFFQNSMYVPQGMHSPGFRVACGVAGASGQPNMGNTYEWVIRARETGGQGAANYGSVSCPADIVPVTSVSLSGPTTGFTGRAYDFTAAGMPVTATLPISYTWMVTGQGVVTASNGLSDTQTLTWEAPGVKEVRVTISNRAGEVVVSRNITISSRLYLPVVVKSVQASSIH